MKKISFFLIFILFGCRSVNKKTEQSIQIRDSIQVVQSDSIIRNTQETENEKRNTVTLSKLNFKIIPGVDEEKRTYAIQDKNGNIVKGEINPTDTLVFSNDVVSIEAFEKMKELKEYYEHRSVSAEKRYSDLLMQMEEEVERKPQPLKWYIAAAVGLLIVILVIRIWK